MELEESDLNECIDDIIAILEDEKELKGRPEAKQAVCKLQQLKDQLFTITTHDEKAACRSAMEAIEKESLRLLLTIDQAKNDIKAKEVEALQNIDEKSQKTVCEALDKLEAGNEIQIESMKRLVDTLAERVKHIETENSIIYKHLKEIDTALTTLKEAQYKNNEKLQYIDQMLELQRELVIRYETFYTRTSVSPLKTNEDDISIAEVYIEPLMIEEERKMHTARKEMIRRECEGLHSKQRQTSNDTNLIEPKTIKGYHDIFHSKDSRRRRIYIVGEVGTGKSCFGQMMLHNWCNAHSQSEEKYSGQENAQNTKGFSCENQNIKEMKYFNFLFYIPLPRLSGFSSDLFEMIKEIYKDILPAEIINAVFEKESEKCCILIDGLDEWTPPRDTPLPQHISYGIPNSNRLRKASIVTLSRLSAKGILNLKYSEVDIRIKLLGVDADAIEKVAEKYMKMQNDTNLTVRKFMDNVDGNLKHLEKNPLLIKQLVWMYCQGTELGTSVTEVYCGIINIILGWCENKDENGSSVEQAITLKKYKGMSLPYELNRYPRCKRNRSFIFVLGDLAFDALTGDTPTTIFGRSKLSEIGLSKFDMSTLTKIGILKEHANEDPTLEQRSFSFIHMSYLEFFAAVYISISDCRTRESIQSKKRRCDKGSTIHEFFMKLKSAADIIQMSNVLKMICGLTPNLFGEVSRHVYEIVENDESLVDYRTTLLENDIMEPEMIQRLLQKCLIDCCSHPEWNNSTTISLSDIVIDTEDIWIKTFLDIIDPQKVLSLSIENLSCVTDNVFKWIARLTSLQNLCIFTETVMCEDFDELLNSVQKAVSLHELIMVDRRYNDELRVVPPFCENAYKCPTHFINLSEHNNLVKIHFQNVPCFQLCINNPIKLETTTVINSFCHSEYFDEIEKLVQNARNIRNLNLQRQCGEPEDMYFIDLSQHFHLETIELSHYICSFGSAENVSNLNTFCLTECSLAAEDCDKLATFLFDAVSLKILCIIDVECRSRCEKHKIDLSKHDTLQLVETIDSCFVTENSLVEVTTE